MRIQCQEELIVSDIFVPALVGTSSLRRSVAAWVTLSLVAALPLASAPVRAQDNYPSKAITIIAPLAPGSAADVFTREVAAEMAKALGQSVVVENKVGAGGNIGTVAIVRSPPDGYTVGQAGQGTMVVNHALYSKPGFDPIKDVAPIAMVANMSNVMVVSENSPYKSVQEVIDAIKKKPPGTFTYSSSGIGTSMHIAGVTFGNLSKTELLHVPYTGAPAAMAAIVAGDVDMGFFNVPAARGLIQGKKLRALAVTGIKRTPTMPDMPTLDELGLKGYDVGSWIAFIAPAGTPAPVIAKLNSTLDRVFAQPAFREKLTAAGYDLQPIPLGSPSALGQLIRDDLAKWTPIIKASGAKVE
jgi:tripartite-type tricarboxylate transporter receptor subunit TctC